MRNNDLFKKIKDSDSKSWVINQYLMQINKYYFVFVPIFEFEYKEGIYDDRKDVSRRYNKLLCWSYYLVDDNKISKHDNWHKVSYNSDGWDVNSDWFFRCFIEWKRDEKLDNLKRPVLIIYDQGWFAEMKKSFYDNYRSWTYSEREDYLGNSLWLVNDFSEASEMIDKNVAGLVKQSKRNSNAEGIMKCKQRGEGLSALMKDFESYYLEVNKLQVDSVDGQPELMKKIKEIERKKFSFLRQEIEKRN